MQTVDYHLKQIISVKGFHYVSILSHNDKGVLNLDLFNHMLYLYLTQSNICEKTPNLDFLRRFIKNFVFIPTDTGCILAIYD